MKTNYDNPEIKKLEEYAAFDILRFILSSCVCLSHMDVIHWNQSGNLAVQVFFALSGWLIGGILYDTHRNELGRFFYNRSTRIWVPYFFTVFALYITSLVHEPVLSPRWFEFLAYDVTFTHNWFTLWPDPQTALQQMPLGGTGNHLWSLAVEEQFYLVAPLIITILPFGRRIAPWACLAVIAYLSGSQYGAISLGVLSVITFKKFGPWYLTKSGTLYLTILMILAAATMVAPPSNHLLQPYTYGAPVFAICVVLLCARPLRRTAFSKWLGGVSFPLYLNAWIGAFAIHAFNKYFSIAQSWYSQPLEFLAGLAVASITYFFIDKAVMENRNRYFKPAIGLILGGLAYALVAIGTVVGTTLLT